MYCSTILKFIFCTFLAFLSGKTLGQPSLSQNQILYQTFETAYNSNDKDKTLKCFRRVIPHFYQNELESSDSVFKFFVLAGTFLYENEMYSESVKLFNKAINNKILHCHSSEDDFKIALTYSMLGNSFGKDRSFDDAILYCDKALTYYKEHSIDNEEYYYELLRNKAIWQTTAGYYKASILNFEAIEKYALAKKDTVLLANSYQDNSRNYENFGFTEKCLDLLERCLFLRKKYSKTDSFDLSISLEDYALLLSDQKQHKKALLALSDSYKLRKSLNSKDTITSFNNFGLLYSNLGNIDSSIYYYSKVINTSKNEYSKSLAYHSIANEYYTKGEYSKALQSNEISHKIWEEKYSYILYLKILSHSACAKYLMANNEYSKADSMLNIALKSNNSSHDVSLDSIYIVPLFIESSNIKCELLLKRYEASCDLKHLKDANNILKQSINLMESYQSNMYYLSNNIQWDDLVKETFDGFLGNSVALFNETNDTKYFEQSLNAAEVMKDRQLSQAVQKGQSNAINIIPLQMKDRLELIKSQISISQKLIYDLNEEGVLHSEEIDKLKSKIIFYKNTLRILEDSIRQKYSKFYHHLATFKFLSLDSLTKSIPNQDLLISYYLNEKNLYSFIIDGNNNFFLNIIPVSNDKLEADIDTLRFSIYGKYIENSPHSEAWHKLQFEKKAFDLYNILIKPIENYTSRFKRLIIIPDKSLMFIPFDALLYQASTNNQSYQSLPYLLKKFSISYSPSISLYQELKNTDALKFSKNFLGIAPKFVDTIKSSSKNAASELVFNEQEVKAINKILNGDALLDKEATEDKYLLSAPNYAIVHLSTHGKANTEDGDFSYMSFTSMDDGIENEKLYTQELYNSTLNSELIVLSACETGIGELSSNRGMISLARGFTFAGARSMITTLWAISEFPTKLFFEHFYQDIKNKANKADALRNAKLSMLNSPYPEPFYWAGFIPTGNMKPLDLKFYNYNYLIIILISLFLIIIFSFLKKKSKNRVP
jgi:CHAT domain-containing protein/tetratricopeptide (TPR) repeat protein